MALIVGKPQQYAGPLAVGPSYSTPGALQPSNGAPINTTYAPQVTQSGGGGSTGVLGASSIMNAAPAAPNAAAIAEANRIGAGREMAGIKARGFESGARTGFLDNTNAYRNDNLGMVNEIRSGQDTINTSRANNALNLRRTMSSIAGGVRQGLRSGGVDLANMNALDSGAAEAMAKAYARAGNQQAGSANNQAELVTNELNTTQTNLDRKEMENMAKLRSWRTTETSRISNKLWNDLTTLEAESKTQGYGGIVDMGVRDRLIAEAAAELDRIDGITNNELQGIRGLTPEEVQAQAMQMEAAGAQIANPFAVEGPQGAFANNPYMEGPAIGQIATGPRIREEQTGLV